MRMHLVSIHTVLSLLNTKNVPFLFTSCFQIIVQEMNVTIVFASCEAHISISTINQATTDRPN
jgi:hypothetical protein